MTRIVPFADEAASETLEGLTVENRTDRVAVYGSLDITRNKQGLAHAKALKLILDEAVRRLEAEPNLPDSIPAPAAAKKVANPFT
jgi:hypothetical protein